MSEPTATEGKPLATASQTPQDGPNSTITDENQFRKAILAWRDINLSSQITQVDAAASDIITKQQDVLVKRKELAQKTKDFRRMEEAEKMVAIKGLLKLYQSFIDDVSNQSKIIQTAFLQLYTPLSEAPDPYPLLEASADSLLMVEDTVPRLKKENERLQQSVSRLTNQLEDRDKQLISERRSQQSSESSQIKKVKEIEDTWNTVLREKETSWNDERKALMQKNEDQEKLMKELKATHEVSRRLAQDGGDSGQGSGESSAVAAELEFIRSELDRSHVRIVDLEQRNSQLTTQLTQSVSHSSAPANLEDEPSFVRLRNDNQALLDRLETVKENREQERSKNQMDLELITRDLEAAKRDRDDFRTKLQRWSDYDVIKQELEVIKRIDFGIGYDDHDDKSIDGSEEFSKHKGDSLEKLLLTRNQKLSDELTDMRLLHNTVERRLQEADEKVEELTGRLEKAESLNKTLESDLLKMQQEVEHSFSGMAGSMVGSFMPRPGHSWKQKHSVSGRISPTSSIISGWGGPSSESPLGDSGSYSSSNLGPGILPMVTAQRDRFKKTVSDLEAEVKANQAKIRDLRSEIEGLKKDNMQLYEKSRYLSSMGSGTGSGGGGQPSATVINMPSSATSGTADRSLDRYRRAYEGHLSPFAAFRNSESTRGMRRLSLPERILLGAVKFIVRDRLACNLFALYFLVVHFFLFSSLL